ncbi:MAG: 16S rRNA (guanine(527)-N(7))-methyltransferase RsmG [Bacteroidales bacterium]|nr:16S rRNA (guanine(527)-N(7))-methyltransferase RsmG [Bacteroidales bacterium]
MQYDKSTFEKAIALWTEWNGKINVVSRKDMDNLYEHHILHSLAIAEYHPFSPGETVLDVGCGGGFPGIPLAIVMPEVNFTLCDSIGKKIMVARSIAEELGLNNVTCINARAESLPGKYDWIVSRAVTSLDNFYPWVKGKYRKGILYLKGGDINEEIAQMCRKCKVNPEQVSAWPINSWLKDEYFAEKFVIQVGKDYLCPPETE